TLSIDLSDEEIDSRMRELKPKKRELTGYLKRYAALVGSADKGAILHDTMQGDSP
ncbi:MAG TPA: hypothetical protein ENN11_03070, partial [Methanomicrobia archaeon]|nr:hypothetical protein [Methanomicrobia archaeon]